LAYQQARRVVLGYEMELAKNEPRKARFRASRQSHEANARLAELNIDHCTIVAPFDGTIQTLSVEAGDHVVPGATLLTLIDPLRVEIPIQLPASVHPQVQIGATCRLTSEGMPGVKWSGSIARIAPSADEASRTFAVYVDVDNRRQVPPLMPGTFVTAEVRGETYVNRLAVPRGAIRNGRVLVAADGVVKVRHVTVERRIAERAVVAGDLRDGDTVILSHLNSLESDAPVRLQTAITGAAGGRQTTTNDPDQAIP
jgi:RND family efflux transporter MFP subunit